MSTIEVVLGLRNIFVKGIECEILKWCSYCGTTERVARLREEPADCLKV
jgi:hypothetical protein